MSGSGESGPQDPSGRGAAKLESLPPRMRERVTQAANQGFPPEYGRVLEEFYRRLARVGESVATPPPDPKPESAPVKDGR